MKEHGCMEKISDYILGEKIHETRKSLIYRGSKRESKPVIVKVLKTRYPTPSEISRFRQEYNLVKNLAIDGVVKTFELVEENDVFAIIEEDFNGVSLKDVIRTKPVDIRMFLKIASRVSEILGAIHKNNIIHLDIKPANILINQKENVIKITDFGISSALTHANDELYNPDVIMGTLSYMSPEQTGRMNRSIDYRTDMYSLGITFYEMLTGVLPFKSKDPMELIHSHIAREPVAPHETNRSIPCVVSSIILKLLSKAPEERYQNCFGLLADIDECIKRLSLKGEIDEFPLAMKDVSIKFNIPQIIVGR
jgi:serine/threonine protein kinase